jgi:hypothetical protein
MRDLNLLPEYSESHALVIGIDQYLLAPPLLHAVDDARAVAEILQRRFLFRSGNVRLLVNAEATKSSILSAYLGFVKTASDPNSRLMIFFAGHGFTASARNREVGFLVPTDGNIDDLSTLICWDELTRSAELISAKHIFFIMDACYGGLVFNRAVPSGSQRFLKDIMLRPVRQALSSGKEDEPVSDGGGPRHDHSIFTGHLLNALEGAARAPEGHLTASGVMSYVYQQVSNDIHSEQTPHYGFLSGDGDFIFDAPQLGSLPTNERGDGDVLITIPSVVVPELSGQPQDIFAIAKGLLSDPRGTIRLHDLVIRCVRKLLVNIDEVNIAYIAGSSDAEKLTNSLVQYESLTRELRGLLSGVAYWGGKESEPLLSKAYARTIEHLDARNADATSGTLKWYPAMLLVYSGGISALANKRYDNLAAILGANIASARHGKDFISLSVALGEGIVALERPDVFKLLPGHERYYVPRSEYLLKLLQPELDDDLFLGKEYERIFDQFEILFALVNAVFRKKRDEHAWGPIGRFGWKQTSWGGGDRPLEELLRESQEMKEDWPPFQAGLFGRDFPFFQEAVSEYAQQISKLPWR